VTEHSLHSESGHSDSCLDGSPVEASSRLSDEGQSSIAVGAGLVWIPMDRCRPKLGLASGTTQPRARGAAESELWPRRFILSHLRRIENDSVGNVCYRLTGELCRQESRRVSADHAFVSVRDVEIRISNRIGSDEAG